MIDRRLRPVFGTQTVSTASLQTNKENVKPKDVVGNDESVASSSGVSVSNSNATNRRSAHHSTDGVLGGPGNAQSKPLTTWLINWLDRNSNAHQADATNVLNNDLDDSSNPTAQKNELNLSLDTVPEEDNTPADLANEFDTPENVIISETNATNTTASSESIVTAPGKRVRSKSMHVTHEENQSDFSLVSASKANAIARKNSNATVDPVIVHPRPGKRGRSKSMHVRLHLDPATDPPTQLRRSNRISVPVHRYNCGIVYCAICRKQFRQDIQAADCYNGAIVCSIKCFKRA